MILSPIPDMNGVYDLKIMFTGPQTFSLTTV